MFRSSARSSDVLPRLFVLGSETLVEHALKLNGELLLTSPLSQKVMAFSCGPSIGFMIAG
jgi:hypothetical protein